MLVGVPLAFVASRFDYRRFQGPLGMQAWWVAVALLVLTYGLGVVRGGARRWIPLGFFNLQPSELAKIACVLVAAALAVEWQRGGWTRPTYLRRLGIFVGVPAVLIVFQPDLGTAILHGGRRRDRAVSRRDRADVGRARGRRRCIAFGVLAICDRSRIGSRASSAALNPWSDPQGKGYQAIQALLAFGTGGIKGVGLGLSRQKFFYLPEAHTDFIFAIIGEEVGLIGTLAVVVAFVVLALRGHPHRHGRARPVRPARRRRAHRHARRSRRC